VNYRLIIFDFDGTLANTFPWILGVIDQVADKYHFNRIDRTELETLRGCDARQLSHLYQVPLWKIPIIAADVRSWMTREIDKIQLFEGMSHILGKMAGEGVILAVVSSNSAENVRRVLGKELAGLFSYFECGVSLFGKKARFNKILHQSGVQPHQAFCIGDELRDIEAAHKAKIPFGAVSWGYTRVEAFHPLAPAEVFHNVADMERLFA
jgi:phosphoglycolate phosphatase